MEIMKSMQLCFLVHMTLTSYNYLINQLSV